MELRQKYRLGEVFNVLDSKRIPLSSKERESRRGNYPYYGAQGIIDYIDDYIFDGEYLLIAEDGENLKSQKQNIAQIARGKYWVNNHAHILESNGKCDIRYICHLLNKMDISGYITGSAQPKLNQANLCSIEVELPDIQEQKRIAEFIGNFDDKIELNRQINDNLEQQAQTLYKSWFVDFEPFKDGAFKESEFGLIPEGWRVGSLSDLTEITMGQSPSGKSYNETGDGMLFYQGRAEFGDRYPSIRLYTTEPSRIAEQNSVLLSVRAPVGDTNIAYNKCCIGRGLASITAKHGFNSFIFYMIKSLKDQFDLYNGEGTVFGSINRDSLNSMKVIVPTNEVINDFEKIVAPLDFKYKSIFSENLLLTQQRDTLLPKLMSGELKINEIDC